MWSTQEGNDFIKLQTQQLVTGSFSSCISSLTKLVIALDRRQIHNIESHTHIYLLLGDLLLSRLLLIPSGCTWELMM